MRIQTIIRKVANKGIKGCYKSLMIRLSIIPNKLIFYYWKTKPIENNLIVLESGGDITDNSYALYDFMGREGYLEKYKVIWLVYEISGSKTEHKIQCLYPNTKIVWGKVSGIHREWDRYLATCKWYIYDHSNMMSSMKKRDGQKLIYLSHGWGYKASKGRDINNDKSVFDFMTVTGPLSAIGLSEYWRQPIEKTIITGYPRIDYFYLSNQEARNKTNNKWHFSRYKKIVFWMPTFRKSISAELSEDYIHNETDLPIFNDFSSLHEFSSFLKEKNILLVFKLHHLQADLPVFHMHFDNIIVVRDEDLQALGIQLYELVSFADVMISDYSSISIDYMILDRPIIYTLDDYEEYDKSRGLIPENAIDYMPGYHAYNKEEVENALNEINNGIDRYREARTHIIDLYHTFRDGYSSKRVLDAIGIYS